MLYLELLLDVSVMPFVSNIARIKTCPDSDLE